MMNAVRKGTDAQARSQAQNLERLFQQVAATALAASLAACGGGGGGGDASPAPPPFVTPAALPAVMSVPTPTGYDANKLAAFNRLNTLRLQAGLGMLASDSKMDEAAQAHADWMVANNIYSHEETAGTPGYTGDNYATRELAVGYLGIKGGEIMGGGIPPAAIVDALVNVVYHREVALSVFPVDVGIGYSSSLSAPAIPAPLVIDFSTPGYDLGRGGGQTAQNSTGGVIVWPIDGAIGTPENMGAELPNPVPGRDVKSLGMPVSLSVIQGRTVNVTSFSLTNVTSNESVNVILLTQASDPNRELRGEYVAIIPYQNLDHETTYRADFVGTVNDSNGVTPLVKSWTFTTSQ